VTKIRLVADDMTGALDAAVQFIGCVPELPVIVTPDIPARFGSSSRSSAALSTGGRDSDPVSAARRTAAAVPFLAKADIAFVKIDSLLRGNWPTDLARLLAAFPYHTCVLAPAFPAQRRIMQDGRQLTPGADGRMTVLPIDPCAALAAAGVRTTMLSAAEYPCANPGSVLLCDAVDDADLESRVRMVRALRIPVLWCGSAGLARALSGRAPPVLSPAMASSLIIVGTHHPVTQAQLAALPPEAVALIGLGMDAVAAVQSIELHLEASPCIIFVDMPPGLSPSAAAMIIADRLTTILPQLRPPDSLVVIGGETLAVVAKAVGADAIIPEGEWQPGVPCSRFFGGRWNGVRLISRSGAFGGPDFLLNLLRHRTISDNTASS
jgi:uncharacterized protein YgbK (DUF1537 family)